MRLKATEMTQHGGPPGWQEESGWDMCCDGRSIPHSLTHRTDCPGLNRLKGQCHEIFCFWFFSWISFPQASDYTIRVVSIYFENSRRYSQLKVCHRCQRHRWQMEKTFKQENFNNFVWTPLGSRVNIYINFCLKVHFKVSAAWYCWHYLPPVSTTPMANLPPASLTPVANLPPVSLTPVANLPPVSTTLAKMVYKFATGVADTGGKFATGVVDTGGAPWLANRRKKSRDTVPLSCEPLANPAV